MLNVLKDDKFIVFIVRVHIISVVVCGNYRENDGRLHHQQHSNIISQSKWIPRINSIILQYK